MANDYRPQDDLYRHINGEWLATTEIPADKSSWGSFMKLHYASQDAVQEIITSLEAGAPTGTPAQQIADLYASYMDEATLEELGVAPLQPLLARVDEVTDVESLATLFGWLYRQGLTTVFGGATDADPFDPTRYLMFLGQDGLGLPDEAYYRLDEHAETRAEYVAHMERLLTLAGLDGAAMAPRVMALETEIAARHWDKVRNRNMAETMNQRTLDDLKRDYPALHLDAYLAGGSFPASAFAELILEQPSYLDELQQLMTQDRLEAWRDWARWHIVSELAGNTTKALADERFAFVGTTLSGTPEQEERWRRGVARVESMLGEPLGKLYVERYFPPESKAKMDILVENLLKAYRASITELDWMTEQTKVEALDKLSKFTPKIGYPNSWRDYSSLEIKRDDLIGNRLRSAAFELDYQLARAGAPMDPDEWLMTPQMVNAYYHPLRNEIVFPAAILQPPFFSPDATDAQNYGGIGAVIGHEIGHGFDDQGSTCDGNGTFRNWWTEADKAAFEERTGKLIAQFDELSPEGADGLKVNGKLTIGENIGDLGGVCIAYKAWRISQGKDDLDGVDDVEGARAFFEQYGTIWQYKARPELTKQRLATDPHSPAEFRCNQIVRNVPMFYAAYDVQPSDGLWLAPEDRVQIW